MLFLCIALLIFFFLNRSFKIKCLRVEREALAHYCKWRLIVDSASELCIIPVKAIELDKKREVKCASVRGVAAAAAPSALETSLLTNVVEFPERTRN